MAFWFALITGTWLLLSIFVSLGLARAVQLSNQNAGRLHRSVGLTNAAIPAIPTQRQRESARQYREPVSALSR